jgi:hypothetical protein
MTKNDKGCPTLRAFRRVGHEAASARCSRFQSPCLGAAPTAITIPLADAVCNGPDSAVRAPLLLTVNEFTDGYRVAALTAGLALRTARVDILPAAIFCPTVVQVIPRGGFLLATVAAFRSTRSNHSRPIACGGYVGNEAPDHTHFPRLSAKAPPPPSS